MANFERLKPQLLQQYPGKFVALRQGEVIAVDDEKMAVLAAAEQAVGNVSFYVGEVKDGSANATCTHAIVPNDTMNQYDETHPSLRPILNP